MWPMAHRAVPWCPLYTLRPIRTFTTLRSDKLMDSWRLGMSSQSRGSVSPALETPKQKCIQGVRECQQDARTRWFKAYAESRSDDARPDKDLILKHSSVHCKNFTIHKAIFDRIHHEYKVIEEGLRHEFRRTA